MKERILCVDDDSAMLRFFRCLGGELVIETAEGAEQALAAVSNQGPYAVILSDMNMPGMNGVQLLSAVRNLAPDTVRIMLTGFADLTTAVEAVNQGHIFRFLAKPCPAAVLYQALKAGVEQHRLLRVEKDLLEKTLTGSIQVLTEVLGLVNPTAFGRATRVRELVNKLARRLGADNAWQFDVAAMLSHLGCVTVPEPILRRVFRGVDLSSDEREVFTSHPRVGHSLIAHIPRLEAVAAAIAYQEKRFDGSGEPADARKGADIPLGGRVLKAALDFDSLESRGFSRENALECMSQRSGWYDPDVLAALTAVLEEESGRVLKEYSVQHLLDQLDIIESPRFVLEQVTVKQLLGRMVLAENVWTDKDLLVLSKGHEITLRMLEKLRNFSRHSVIREPIRVWVRVS